jgi:ATP:corrinoid adenosyltransferase
MAKIKDANLGSYILDEILIFANSNEIVRAIDNLNALLLRKANPQAIIFTTKDNATVNVIRTD